jgi:hypothetical protein
MHGSTEVINFVLFDGLDGFSGHLSFDHRDLGDLLFAEGIINCLLGFVFLLQDVEIALLLSPVVRTFNEIAGSPASHSCSEGFPWGRQAILFSLGYCNGCYKMLTFVFALSCDVDHCIAFVAMDDPWFIFT